MTLDGKASGGERRLHRKVLVLSLEKQCPKDGGPGAPFEWKKTLWQGPARKGSGWLLSHERRKADRVTQSMVCQKVFPLERAEQCMKGIGHRGAERESENLTHI